MSQLQAPQPGSSSSSGKTIPDSWLREGRISDRAAFLLAFFFWGLLLVTVQPWSRVGADLSDSSSTFKGLLLLFSLIALLMLLPPRAALRVPPPLALYLLYGVYVITSSMFQSDAPDPVFRGARLLLGLVAPVVLWSVVRGRFYTMALAVLAAHAVLAMTVLAGIVLAPDLAWQDAAPFRAERLVGAFLPMLAPRVGEIGAILVGLASILWAQKRIGPMLLTLAGSSGGILIVLSQTRTAALALVMGLTVAFVASAASPAARRGMVLMASSVLLSLPFLPRITEWVLRYQDAEEIEKLSGRTTVWDHIISQPYDPMLFWFGHGIGDKKIVLRRGEGDINTMAVDNSWLDSYWETGVLGALLVAVAVVAAAAYAVRTPGLEARTFACFLMSYVLVASVNESGLCDFSSMTLLVLSAVLISAVDRERHNQTGSAQQSAATPVRQLLASTGRRDGIQER